MFSSLMLAIALVLPHTSQQAGPALRLNVAVGLAGAEQRGFTRAQLEDALTVLAAAKFRDAIVVQDDTDALNLSLSVSCVSGACSWRARLTTKLTGGPLGDVGLADWWSEGGIMRDRGGLEPLREQLGAALDRPAAAWLRLSPAQRDCWTRYFADPIGRLPATGASDDPDLLLRAACVPAG